jgi:hypothetical protein
MGTEPESVYAQKGTMQDVLARCLKKTEAQVCTKINIFVCLQKDIQPSFSQNMLIGKLTFKIYIAQYVHEIIANSCCLFLVHMLCLYNNRCLFFVG